MFDRFILSLTVIHQLSYRMCIVCFRRRIPQFSCNHRSAILWDLICDVRQGGQIEVDGEWSMAGGGFVVRSSAGSARANSPPFDQMAGMEP
jgi:hypothetical protein